MSQEGDTKTCWACCTEIPAAAKQCPYCRLGQGRFPRLVRRPYFSVPFIGVMTAILATSFVILIWMFVDIISQGEPFQRHADDITVIDSKIGFDEDECRALVVVRGKIRNAGPRTWKKTLLQVDFLNAKGELFDAGQESEYRSPSLPAGQEVAFEASFPRQFPEAEYAGHRVRVISATDATARFFFR